MKKFEDAVSQFRVYADSVFRILKQCHPTATFTFEQLMHTYSQRISAVQCADAIIATDNAYSQTYQAETSNHKRTA